MFSKYFGALILFSATTVAFAGTSKDYALAGANAVTAASCLSDLVNYPKDEKLKEVERMEELLTIFQRDGHLFIEGVKNKKINQEDAQKYVPVVLFDFFGLQISDDFYLGRIYESLSSNEYKKLTEGLNSFSKSFEQDKGYNATTAYSDSKCDLIK